MFEPISKIKSSKEKKFFIEKLNIYSRFIELIAKSLKIEFKKKNFEINKNTFLKLKRSKCNKKTDSLAPRLCVIKLKLNSNKRSN